MGFYATFKSTTSIENAYFRIQRIWGSKREGWSAWVAVYNSKDDKDHVKLFSLNVPFVENENPYPVLYDKIKSLEFVVVSTQKEPIDVVKTQIEEIKLQPAKKGRSKKNSA